MEEQDRRSSRIAPVTVVKLEAIMYERLITDRYVLF